MADIPLNIEVKSIGLDQARNQIRQLELEIVAAAFASDNKLVKALENQQRKWIEQTKVIAGAQQQVSNFISRANAMGASATQLQPLINSWNALDKAMGNNLQTRAQMAERTQRFDRVFANAERNLGVFTNTIHQQDRVMKDAIQTNNQYDASILRQQRSVATARQQLLNFAQSVRVANADPRITKEAAQEFARFQATMQGGTLTAAQFQAANLGWMDALGKGKRDIRDFTNHIQPAREHTRRFSAALQDVGSAAVLIHGPLSGIGSRVIAFSAILQRSSAGLAAWTLGIAGIIALLQKAVKEAAGEEDQLLTLNAVLRASGRAGQVSAEQIKDFTDELGKLTKFRPDDLLAAYQAILQFGTIPTNNMEEIIGWATDFATVMGTDVKSAALQLGKAIEADVGALEGLKRAGLSLNAQQIEQIQTFRAIGDTLGIINVLRQGMGNVLGTAKAASDGLTKSISALGKSWNMFMEEIGKLLPLKEATEVIRALNGLVTQFKEALGAGITLGARQDLAQLRSEANGFMADIMKFMADKAAWLSRNLPESMKGSITAENIEGTQKWFKDLEDFYTKRSAMFQHDADMIKEVMKNPPGQGSNKPTEAGNTGKPRGLPGSELAGEPLVNFQKEIKELELQWKMLGDETTGYAEGPLALVHAKTIEFAKANHLLGLMTIGMNGELQKAPKEVMELNDALIIMEKKQAAKKIFNETRTAVEQYREQLDIAYAALTSFSMGQETYRRALFKANEELKNSTPYYRETRTAAEHFDDQLVVLNENLRVQAINSELAGRQLGRMKMELIEATPVFRVLAGEMADFGDTFVEILDGAENRYQTFRDAINKLSKEIAADFFRLSAQNPIKNELFGTNLPTTEDLNKTFDRVFGGTMIGDLFGIKPGLNPGDAVKQSQQQVISQQNLTAATQQYNASVTQNTASVNFSNATGVFAVAVDKFAAAAAAGGGGGGGGLGGMGNMLGDLIGGGNGAGTDTVDFGAGDLTSWAGPDFFDAGGSEFLTTAILHRGGRAGMGGAMRSVPTGLFFGAPRYHNGTPGAGLGPDEIPAVLQRGEEVIPRGRSGRNVVVKKMVFQEKPNSKTMLQMNRNLNRLMNRGMDN